MKKRYLGKGGKKMIIIIKTYPKYYEKANRFIELFNRHEYYSLKEIMKICDIDKRQIKNYLYKISRKVNLKIKERESERVYSVYRRDLDKMWVRRQKVKEKLYKLPDNATLTLEIKGDMTEVQNKGKVIESEIDALKQILGTRKEISKRELKEIGVKINFRYSIKDLIGITNDMGVRVIC